MTIDFLRIKLIHFATIKLFVLGQMENFLFTTHNKKILFQLKRNRSRQKPFMV